MKRMYKYIGCTMLALMLGAGVRAQEHSTDGCRFGTRYRAFYGARI